MDEQGNDRVMHSACGCACAHFDSQAKQQRGMCSHALHHTRHSKILQYHSASRHIRYQHVGWVMETPVASPAQGSIVRTSGTCSHVGVAALLKFMSQHAAAPNMKWRQTQRTLCVDQRLQMHAFPITPLSKPVAV